MMTIKQLTQTCSACPSQWEGELADGRGLYVRYRWGGLSVSVSRQPGDDPIFGPIIHQASIGESFDGQIEWEAIKDQILALDVDTEIARYDKEVAEHEIQMQDPDFRRQYWAKDADNLLALYVRMGRPVAEGDRERLIEISEEAWQEHHGTSEAES
jgi:hypothetical protein